MSVKMERNRETRRARILGSNGFNRKRLRTNSLTSSLDEDGVELQESVRLRDRVRRHRDRERGRDFRERGLKERPGKSKRRSGYYETSEESLNEDEDYDGDEETIASASSAGRIFPPLPAVSVSAHHRSQQHTNNYHLQLRRSFPPGFSSSSSTAEGFVASPVCKPGDEILGVSIPRKARSASTKRSRDWNTSRIDTINCGGARRAERILRQVSSSPATQHGISSPSAAPPAVPMSPYSFFKKKLKAADNNKKLNLKPPKSSSSTRQNSNPEELEFEIAEVLFGLMTQYQIPPSSQKDDSKQVQISKGDVKSSSISDSGQIRAVGKRKRLRPVVGKTDQGPQPGPAPIKVEMDQPPKSETSSSGSEKMSTGENGFEAEGDLINSGGRPAGRSKMEESTESKDLVMKERESGAAKNEDNFCSDSSLTATASSSFADSIIETNLMVSEVGTQTLQKFEIDPICLPPQARSWSPESATPSDQAFDPTLSTVDEESKLVAGKDEEKITVDNPANLEKKSNGTSDLPSDLAKNGKNENGDIQECGRREMQIQTNKQVAITDKSGRYESRSPLPISSGGPSDGFMAPPMQESISKDDAVKCEAKSQEIAASSSRTAGPARARSLQARRAQAGEARNWTCGNSLRGRAD